MKLLMICSKQFYSKIEEIKKELEKKQIEIFLPNCYDDPKTEDKMRELGPEAHRDFKARMFKQSEETIKNMDAVLVLNYDKNKNGVIYKNYIGGATFLEMYEAFRYGKKIYLMNDIPEGILYDEIDGFDPIVLNGNLELVDARVKLDYKSATPNIEVNPGVTVSGKKLYELYQATKEKCRENHVDPEVEESFKPKTKIK